MELWLVLKLIIVAIVYTLGSCIHVVLWCFCLYYNIISRVYLVLMLCWIGLGLCWATLEKFGRMEIAFGTWLWFVIQNFVGIFIANPDETTLVLLVARCSNFIPNQNFYQNCWIYFYQNFSQLKQSLIWCEFG